MKFAPQNWATLPEVCKHTSATAWTIQVYPQASKKREIRTESEWKKAKN